MNPDDIRTQNIDKILTAPQEYDGRFWATLSPACGFCLLAFGYLGISHIDPFSFQGLVVLFGATTFGAVSGRFVYNKLRPTRRYKFLAFSAPRWDAQLATTIEIDIEGSHYFVDDDPIVKVTKVDEWYAFRAKNGVVTYFLIDDVNSLTTVR